MIQANQLTFSYGRRQSPVLSDFSLTIEAGRVYGLLGKNGTGKSTLLHLLAGLLRPQAGQVLYEGIDVGLRRPEVQGEVFLVPEEFELPDMRLSRYVSLNAPFYPHFSHDVLQECLADFELPADLRLCALSMGQRKKAFMSFALATGSRLLLMDEPTNGLDIPSKNLFRRVVANHLTEERTLIVSTHQVADVTMLIDHVLIIEDARLWLNQSTADLCRAFRFEERPMGAPVDDALYVQPSLQGQKVLLPNDRPDEETPLDLELLFNAALAGKLPAEALLQSGR